jgi:gliding motility-associated-like protein
MVTCSGVPVNNVIETEAGKKWKYRAELTGSGTVTVVAAFASNTDCGVAAQKEIAFPKGIEMSYELSAKCEETTPVRFYFTSGAAPYELTFDDWASSFTVNENNVATEYPSIAAGQYTIKIKDVNGCLHEQEMNIPGPIKAEALLGDAGITDATCAGVADGSILFNLGNNRYNFWWKDNSQTDEEKTGEYGRTNLEAGEYEVEISYSSELDVEKCPVIETIVVDAANTINVTITGEDVYCPDSEVMLMGSIEMNPVKDAFTAEWVRIDGTPEQWKNEGLKFPATEGTVTLTASIKVGNKTCTANDEFEVKLSTPEAIDFGVIDPVIYVPDDADFGELNVVAPEGDRQWASEPQGYTVDDTAFPMVLLPRPNQEYLLTLTVADENGCPSVGRIRVDIATGFFIPNAITPNLDGINDTWKFRNLEKYTGYYDVQVAVFNRGGSQVYAASHYSNDTAWDGCRSGQDLPIGTYHYVVRLVPKTTSGGKLRIITGSITIIR